MITPAFELSQEPNFLTIIIHVPYAKVNEVDLYIDGVDFKFYAKPYFLRLTLPGRLVEDGREKASYDADTGTLTIKVPKETPDEHFEGLNMLTVLLAPKGSRSAKPLLEEIGPSIIAEEEEEEFDWEIEQSPFVHLEGNVINSSCFYGFANLRSGVFERLQHELSDVIDLKEPDRTTIVERRQKRLTAEETKFDSDHYLADLFEDDAIQHLLMYEPWWANTLETKEVKKTQNEQHLMDPGSQFVKFSKDEKEQLRNFSNKSYLLDRRSCQNVYLGLLDILLAYAYEVRSTEGESNTESSWNIWKLSGTLCWLETYRSLQEVLVSFSRRVLCYPFYRHFQLALKAVEDAVLILQLGKSAVLKCLLGIHKIFRESDPAYLLNDLYITDYCIWIQKVKSKKLASLAESLQNLKVTKNDLGFELEDLEKAALLVQEEENEIKPGKSGLQSLASESETEEDNGSEELSSSPFDGGESDSDESDSSKCSRSEELCGKGLCRRAEADCKTEVKAKEDFINSNCGEETVHTDATWDPDKCPLGETSTAKSPPRRLMEELADQLQSVGFSEPCEKSAAENSEHKPTSLPLQSLAQYQHSQTTSQQTFLEVSPKRNCLLLVADPVNTEDFTNLA
ncbi:protein SHQ1 homolog isoform X2 [Scyliorhinus torazame]|uniref:protein SHQ1 homolog isoform X2 n=1 Tax=Scyliorhinus torazame TaxID=75743 RepID=UPI003B5C623A